MHWPIVWLPEPERVVMNGELPDGMWATIGKVVERGVGWVFAGAMLYALYVLGPEIMRENRDAFLRQGNEFAKDIQKIADTATKNYEINQQSTKVALEAFRQDEREDRRLFVEILKRSNMTPAELSEAVRAAGEELETDNQQE